ncbi:hypothetical protein [Streptomyces sp. NPDC050560]|uniref:hypothetical protein n=1 Tax=Streptomyces sp. NPDC050560 TaxID=3365630 RepID=UPI00378A6037
MAEHVSILQQMGVAALAGAAAAWTVSRVRLARRSRPATEGHPTGGGLGVLPRQALPPVETVVLTPAERDAFARLVRQFGEGRH